MPKTNATGHLPASNKAYPAHDKNSRSQEKAHAILIAISIIAIIGSLSLAGGLYPSLRHNSLYFLAGLPPASLSLMIFSTCALCESSKTHASKNRQKLPVIKPTQPEIKPYIKKQVNKSKNSIREEEAKKVRVSVSKEKSQESNVSDSEFKQDTPFYLDDKAPLSIPPLPQPSSESPKTDPLDRPGFTNWAQAHQKVLQTYSGSSLPIFPSQKRALVVNVVAILKFWANEYFKSDEKLQLEDFAEGLLKGIGEVKEEGSDLEKPHHVLQLAKCFNEAFQLIVTNGQPNQERVIHMLAILSGLHEDHKTSQGYLDYSTINKQLRDFNLAWLKPIDQSKFGLLQFYLDRFKIDAVDTMVRAQSGLCLIRPHGRGNPFSSTSKRNKANLLINLYPTLSTYSAEAFVEIQDSSTWKTNGAHLRDLKKIFPKGREETNLLYSKRVHALGQLPLQLLLCPLEDTKKALFLVELLQKELSIPKSMVILSHLQEIDQWDASTLPEGYSPAQYFKDKQPFLDCLNQYFLTRKEYAKYLSDVSTSSDAIPQQLKAFMQEEGVNLTEQELTAYFQKVNSKQPHALEGLPPEHVPVPSKPLPQPSHPKNDTPSTLPKPSVKKSPELTNYEKVGKLAFPKELSVKEGEGYEDQIGPDFYHENPMFNTPEYYTISPWSTDRCYTYRYRYLLQLYEVTKFFKQWGEDLKFSPEDQQNLNQFIDGIRLGIGIQSNTSSYPITIALAIDRQLHQAFVLIKTDEKPEEKLCLLLTLLIKAHRDGNKPNAPVNYLCFGGIAGVIAEFNVSLINPKFSDPKKAIEFYRGRFALTCLEEMMKDQSQLHVNAKTGGGEYYQESESELRRNIFAAIHPVLKEYASQPFNLFNYKAFAQKVSLSSTGFYGHGVSRPSLERQLEEQLLYIFPKSPKNESDASYSRRLYHLGRVPTQLPFFPYHDGNKSNMIRELLLNELGLPKECVVVGELDELKKYFPILFNPPGYKNRGEVLDKQRFLKSISTHYCTIEKFAEYLLPIFLDTGSKELYTQIQAEVYTLVGDEDEKMNVYFDLSKKGILTLKGMEAYLTNLQNNNQLVLVRSGR